jgi:predicted nucleotidyltransferase
MDPRALDDIARRHAILLLLQFGSTVTGRAHADSGLDLAVLLEHESRSLIDQMDLIGDLQALTPGREVDIALLNTADPLFLRKIVETATLVYGPARRFYEFKTYAFKRYQDHRRYLALECDYVAGRLSRATR